MKSVRLFGDHTQTEEEFRSFYGSDVRERSMRCCNGMPDEQWCKNKCHFLIVDGIGHVDEKGFPPVFGIDCDVDILCCGGDVDEVTPEAYCKNCVQLRSDR